MINKIRLILALTVWFGMGLHIQAERGSFQSIGSVNGLSDLVVNSIFKDSRGYVWLGTGLGLDRFDGNNIHSYPIPGENLNEKRVRAIAEVGRHDIYIGNASGLYKLGATDSEITAVMPQKINVPVNALVAHGDTLFVASEAGLFEIDTERRKLSRVLLDSDVMSTANNLTAMHLTEKGDLWMATSRGLTLYDTTLRQFNTYAPQQGFDPTSLAATGDTLFVGTYGDGIVPFKISERRYLPAIAVGNGIVTGLSVSDGALVVATDGSGVFVTDASTGRTIRHYHVGGSPGQNLRSNSVYSIMTDEKGLLWVGYYQDGADYTLYSSPVFEIYGLADGGFSTMRKTVRAVAVDGEHKLIGTREGLIYVNDRTRETIEFKSPQINSNIIFCIKKWRNRFYIGTYNGGMYVFDAERKSLMPFSPDTSFDAHESVFALTEDASGKLWVASSRGVYMLDASGENLQTRVFTSRNSHLPRGNVYEIFFDSTGRGWICTETGVAVWNGSTIRSDRFPQGFINHQKIRDIYEDGNHNLYFLPDRGDIYRSNLQLTEFGPLEELSAATNRAATFMCGDDAGMLWIGSERGLVRYDGKETLRYFGVSDGLPGKVFTFCTPVTDSDGNLWFGNNQGLIRLKFDRLRSETSMKRLPEVTDISTNGHSVINRLHAGRNLYTLELESNENNLTISHANFDYTMPGDQMVEYMLEGYDSGWQMKTGAGQMTYYNLPAGKYRFRIRHAGDIASETGYDIRIKRNVNVLAILFGVIGVLALGGAVYACVLLMRHRRENTERQQREDRNREEADRKAHEEVLRRYKTTRLSDEECKRLFKRLENVMRSERPFTNPNLKSGDLGAMTGATPHALSFLFNQYLHKNYYDYINEYRVAEFKRLVSELDTSKYTLTAMSQMCGFSSRASFFRHFKNLTGITPADYLKSLKR